MNIAQNQIKRTLMASEGLVCIRSLLDTNPSSNRSQLAAKACEQLGLHDLRGQAQLGGCLKALRELERAGHFTLPLARKGPGPSSPRRLPEPVAQPTGVPAEVGQLQGLELILVNTLDQMRIWNELMLCEHPQGAGPLVGRQLRYLIGSTHGWLGGFGFAAPALNLGARDSWIGWNHAQRRDYLHYCVNMSRFLVRTSVRCQNLASKVLSQVLGAMPQDFEKQYGYRPQLVESFVDTAEFIGTCYKAANWQEIGKTQGRGRQDRFNKKALSPKAIYVYPLQDDFRARMGVMPNAGGAALSLTQGLESDVWAQHEFGGAALGDARLTRRLVSVAGAKAEVPGRAFCGVAKGYWAQIKAYYRLIDSPEESAVSMANILEPHRARTVRRMMGQKVVLCVQDGSDLNYNTLDRCQGLGVIGSNQTGAKSRGLHLHSTLALSANGLPLGVLRADCTAPQEKSRTEERPAHAIPIEEKKNCIWIEHHRTIVALASQMPNTRLINVCDREADFFELFDEQRKNPRVELLIRAKHDRNITQEPHKLFAAVRETPAVSRVHVPVPRKSARTKKSKQKACVMRCERLADVTLRYMPVQLVPSHYHADKAPVDIWVVHAVEENPPLGAEPLEWFLLTTLALTSGEDAQQCLRWYCLRWRIEDWHRVLKSGCAIEDLAHKSVERLRRAIAINLVIAWRIMAMTLLGREVPELPAQILFSDIELRTLRAYAKKKIETTDAIG